MGKTREELIELLNHNRKSKRLSALKNLKNMEVYDKKLIPIERELDANNHIHTFYSFSPYSPTKAAYKAYISGLKTMGIMDHDTLSGADEFIKACKILGTSSTVGFEFRAKFNNSSFQKVKINNPDQAGVAYIAVHGIPHQNIKLINKYLQKYRDFRNVRNKRMIDKINSSLSRFDISLSFEKDVKPLSKYKEGGSITERHLMLALANALIVKFGKTEKLINFVEKELKIEINDKSRKLLIDNNNPFYEYDLLGLLKSDTNFFYINASDECCDVEEFAKFVNSMGAVLAYPYLGDIVSSVTGDKKAQKLEDSYLDELIEYIKKLNFDAVAFMPTRNTTEQLIRVKKLCEKYELFEISGEDINSPRQKFECEALSDPRFQNLIDSTWALIGHEKSASVYQEDGMFTEKTKKFWPTLAERIKLFAVIGKKN